MFAPLLICLLVLLALGGAERLARDRAWREVPVRIHVNGTRAKSTLTRLIWSALCEAGVPALAKTTGTAARLLLPDRREEPVRRRGPANIREQLECMRYARRLGARAVVVECMALNPPLQYVSEREIVRATIGVITNVRFDHTDVMGRTLPSIAATLANTIPSGGTLVTGAQEFAQLFRDRASRLGTRVVVVEPDGESEGGGNGAGHERWVAEDTALALGVTRELGIDDTVARRGFARAPLDPGAVRYGAVSLAGGDAAWTDASAANDPDSLALLLAGFQPWNGTRATGGGGRSRILVFNHRSDRVPRLSCFAERCAAFTSADHLVITGCRPPLTLWGQLARLREPKGAEFVPSRGLATWLAAHAPGATLAFCGNTRGLDVPRLLEEAASRD